jgi:hypothetical protein
VSPAAGTGLYEPLARQAYYGGRYGSPSREGHTKEASWLTASIG